MTLFDSYTLTMKDVIIAILHMSFFEKNVMVFLSNAPKKKKKEGREEKKEDRAWEGCGSGSVRRHDT